MNKITKAVEWARTRGPVEDKDGNHPAGQTTATRPPALPSAARPTTLIRPPTWSNELILDDEFLRSQRIIAHDARSKAFDMLRTSVLQAMDAQGWRSIAVTSPTPSCGATVTAINLAFSIARSFDRAALLVDLNLQSPQVASRLGIDCKVGLVDLLTGRATLSDAVNLVRINNVRLAILPAEQELPNSSEWMSSRAMALILESVRKGFPSHVVIFDLPAVLAGDDTIALLPRVDCALLVAAAGETTVQHMTECKRYMQDTSVVRVVVNKSKSVR